MAYANISKPSLYNNTVLYTGDSSSTRGITGFGFQPDLVWVKCRNAANPHLLSDAVRGTNNNIQSDSSAAQAVDYSQGWVSAFDSDGYTAQAGSSGDNDINGNTNTYASWCWKAGTTTGITTNGSTTITPDAYSFNQSAGISIVKYTGNATAGAKVPHGLGVAPSMILVKVLSTTNNWGVYMEPMGATNAMYLDQNSGETSDGWLNNTAPDDVNFTLSNGNYGNTSGNTHIAYCFANIKGYSKVGSYQGNSNADGTYVYTGFKPSWLMIKWTSTQDWEMFDNKRSPYNQVEKNLEANTTDTENTDLKVDLLCNGFKLRKVDDSINNSSNTYQYLAFAEEPLVANVGSSIPATAR